MIDKFEGRYSFLSNFYHCEIYYQGIVYPSVEHYYVALKCNNDQMIDGVYYTRGDFRELISKIKTAGKAKKMGRTLSLRKDWEDVKLKVMEYGLRQKYNHPELKEQLLSTGDNELVEGNWWHDNVFGSCTCARCGNKGANHLGRLLMTIREEIKAKESN